MSFLDLYHSGRVRRFHTLADYSEAVGQTVAEHQWGVALLVLEICMRLRINPRPELLREALLHDCAECRTGDLPANLKWRWPALTEELRRVEAVVREELEAPPPSLSDEETLMLEWADSLELYLYAQCKVRSGNFAYTRVVRNVGSHLRTARALPNNVGMVLMQEMTL